MRTTGRRQFLIVAAALAAVPAYAQPTKRIARVGFLSPAGKPGPSITAVMHGLQELGYREGQNIVMEVRYADEKLERLPSLAAELVRLDVDVMIPLGPPATRAARQATKSIPIVLVGNVDPVGTGLVASLARPGGNITGMSTLADQTAAKRLELLRELIAQVRRVGVFWDPGEPEEAAEWNSLQRTARTLEMELLSLPVRGFGEVQQAFAKAGRAEALLNVGYLGPPRYRGKPILELAQRHRLPSVFGWPGLVQAGGLFSYNPDFDDVFRRAATYVHKLLQGARPAELPIEQPTKFEFVINLKTAKDLGLAIPPSALLRADRVIN